MPSTVPGLELQRVTALLLRFHWTVSSGEELIGHAKADLRISRTEFGQSRRLAVECKDYARPLTLKDVTQVWAQYQPLMDSRAIDGLLLITSVGIVANAAALVRDTPGLFHQTVSDLQRGVMAFDPYLRSLIRQYEHHEDGLAAYYVEPRTVSGDCVIRQVHAWLAESDAQGLAILGTYGQGKTSFAMHLAAELASKALELGVARTPVLLQLGEYDGQMTIDAMVSHALVTQANVQGYSWQAFEELNAAGRLLVMCDGFDEMRQGTSATALRHNFDQLRRLVVGDSKVLILGRPTAFLSDAEHLEILQGIEPAAVLGPTLTSRPFREVTLAPWNESEINRFVAKYLRWRLVSLDDVGVEAAVARGQAELTADHLADLASRPVQLKMLAEILPSWERPLSELTRVRLYSHFIDRIIERDTTKHDRSVFGVGDRRRFAREIAMWLWCTTSQARVEPYDLPPEILGSFVSDGQSPTAALRGLMSGCFLDRKLGDSLVIPHRSFQEMLVAEELLIGRWAGSDTLDTYWSTCLSERLTEEVVDFALGMATSEVVGLFADRLASYRGSLSVELLEMFAPHLDIVGERFDSPGRDRSSPWWPVIFAKHGGPSAAPRLMARLLESPCTTREELLYCAVIVLALLSSRLSSNDHDLGEEALARLLSLRWTDGSRLAEFDGEPVGAQRLPGIDPSVPLELAWIAQRMVLGRGHLSGQLDLRGLPRAFGDVLQSYCLPVDSYSRGRRVGLGIMASISGDPQTWDQRLQETRPLSGGERLFNAR